MIVKSVALKNFRNHSYLSYDFSKGMNVITGPNAAGKTNVVEGIAYLSLARSFRTTETSDLIQKGKEKAEIEAVIAEGEIVRKLRTILFKDSKILQINGKNVSKLSELIKCLNVTVFEPNDAFLFKGPPKERRNFLDVSLSRKSPIYFEYLSRYQKILKDRNDILKSENPDPILLETNTEMLSKLAGPIISYREMYVKDINDILIKITRALTGAKENLQIIYKPFVENGKEVENNAKQAFNRALENDLKKKVTSVGVHREDFSIALKGRDIGIYGSQGENRIVALALKLAPYFLIEDTDKRPVIVLDDVMSELDDEHKNRLLKFLAKFEQVFITSTELKVNGANHFYIKKKLQEVF